MAKLHLQRRGWPSLRRRLDQRDEIQDVLSECGSLYDLAFIATELDDANCKNCLRRRRQETQETQESSAQETLTAELTS